MPPMIRLSRGDITLLPVEAVVTAAKPQLAASDGVDAAVHRAAGPELLQACRDIYREKGECAPGNAVLTNAYQLRARFVIHAVGPVWPSNVDADEGSEELESLKEMLYLAYQNSLKLAYENHCKSVAFPCISTGASRFPKLVAARIALTAIKRFCQDNPQVKEVMEDIHLVCFDEENYQVYCEIFS
ncbi:macro domain-containing protein [Candidatus Haliotispira prima]|uniref:Macro domain-containing protein n=1 Tax=Candidatus Haliotispira prima TaxID=3034016 RepID=A0ABY8MI77_9SPIO|nr:macro domain-containing protein [Candidatus Haliotispira prima]